MLSRTDSIGDVVLTLPMAGWIKRYFPESRVCFLGRSYTKDVVALSEHVDEFINYDELEKMPEKERTERVRQLKADVVVHVFPQRDIAQLFKLAGTPLRVGTTNRPYHWLTCNRLIRLSRKNSTLHESQLNLKLLTFLHRDVEVAASNMPEFYGFTKLPALAEEYKKLIDPAKRNVILHPKSKGSAREWGLDNFSRLIDRLPSETYKVFISGTAQDGELLKELVAQHPAVTDLTGKLSLQQFIAFIGNADALVAASTGPLHIAAALGKTAIGLFSPMRPIHPGRWRPLGRQAHYLVFDEQCKNCAAGKDCQCIREIRPEQIVHLLEPHE